MTTSRPRWGRRQPDSTFRSRRTRSTGICLPRTISKPNCSKLNRWVDWLRHTYGLPASVIPPCWHRHPELLWELSALHLHWLCAYDPDQNGSAPLGWHRDFADARARLRDWVATSGTRLDRDRPTRQTNWPGEDPAPPIEETPITDRDEDFVQFVLDEVAARQEAEDAFFAAIDPDSGEV
ncbi:hypothetical protein [Actinomyces sp. W5033]|uniref:hypothetical protein n=1 Tax=Actinomyces sp. W5033 TaxID=3446479 RepID=UPI003EDF67F2